MSTMIEAMSMNTKHPGKFFTAWRTAVIKSGEAKWKEITSDQLHNLLTYMVLPCHHRDPRFGGLLNALSTTIKTLQIIGEPHL